MYIYSTARRHSEKVANKAAARNEKKATAYAIFYYLLLLRSSCVLFLCVCVLVCVGASE